MPFLNETVHPKAQSLINHLLLCACKRDNGDSQFYKPLASWQAAQGMSDERTSDLYARLEEAYTKGGFLAVNDSHRISAVSKALWANEVIA